VAGGELARRRHHPDRLEIVDHPFAAEHARIADCAAAPHEPQRVEHGAPPDQIHCAVDAARRYLGRRALGEARALEDDGSGSALAQAARLGLAARRGDRAQAGCARQLEAREAHRRRRAAYEQRLAGDQVERLE
jgi:hypothetical protein